MKDKEKKQTLFNRGVKAFQALSGDTRRVYFCPICGQGFGKESLDKGILTLEHVPPKLLGGKAMMLTCVNCNTMAGHKVDAAIDARNQHYRLFDALRNRSTDYMGRVKVEMGGERLNFNLSIKKDLGAEFFLAGNDPKTCARWQDQMKHHAKNGTWHGQSFNISPTRNPKVPCLASQGRRSSNWIFGCFCCFWVPMGLRP